MNFARKAPTECGKCFNYTNFYFSMIDEDPITVEENTPGSFTKYINNNGEINLILSHESKEVLEKCECFVHYSYVSTDKKMVVVDLTGVDYNLCDPEIATMDLLNEGALTFCAGNC